MGSSISGAPGGPPGSMEASDFGKNRLFLGLRALWTVGEPLLALTLASLLTGVLSLPFLPLELRVEFTLESHQHAFDKFRKAVDEA